MLYFLRIKNRENNLTCAKGKSVYRNILGGIYCRLVEKELCLMLFKQGRLTHLFEFTCSFFSEVGPNAIGTGTAETHQ